MTLLLQLSHKEHMDEHPLATIVKSGALPVYCAQHSARDTGRTAPPDPALVAMMTVGNK